MPQRRRVSPPSLSLIVAIGAQNAFVLRQGLLRQHVFWLCLICAGSDAILISIGVAGFGALSEQAPWLEAALRYGGAAFLLLYGLRSFHAATRPRALKGPRRQPQACTRPSSPASR